MKHRLFTIGGLSKLTGVHVRCLRYYEQLGILKPDYVDESSGYRYYSFYQMRIVEAIQYCVELDIPLKEFSRFISEKDGKIDYASLVTYGTEIAEQKMKSIQMRKEFLQKMQKEISHAGNCYKNRHVKEFIAEKHCWAIPYDGVQTGEEFNSRIYQLVTEIEKHGLRAGYNNGQFMFCNGEIQETYLFIDLWNVGENIADYPQIIKIPGGEYECVVSRESHIQKAPEIFSEQFAAPYPKIVVEVELFSAQFHYNQPVFELRCLSIKR